VKVKLVKVSHMELQKVCRMFVGNVHEALYSLVEKLALLTEYRGWQSEIPKNVRWNFEMSDFKIHVWRVQVLILS